MMMGISNINKQYILILMVVFGGLFSGFSFIISSMQSMQYGTYLIFTISFFALSILFGGILLGSLSDGFEPFEDRNIRVHRIIITSFVLSMVLTSSFFITYYSDLTDEWNQTCYKKGLQAKCMPIDECKKNCIDLNKEYYKYENSGIFNNDNCWCIKGESPEQIW